MFKLSGNQTAERRETETRGRRGEGRVEPKCERFPFFYEALRMLRKKERFKCNTCIPSFRLFLWQRHIVA